MKLAAALALACCTVSLPAGLLAQKSTPAKPVHHTTAAAKTPLGTSTTACGSGSDSNLPAAIPKISGCATPLYALRYVDTKLGTGAAAVPRKWYTVNYTGYLLDGTVFDTSVGKDKDGKDKEPITFPYGAQRVIAGWDTGFEGMKVGGTRRLFIPYQLAYGELGRPPVIPAKAELIFDVELVNISDTPPTPKAPPTPAAGAPGTKPASPAPSGTAPSGTSPAGTTPPAGTSDAKPAQPGATTTAPATTSTPATTKPTADPTKPTAVPPAGTPPPVTSPKP